MCTYVECDGWGCAICAQVYALIHVYAFRQQEHRLRHRVEHQHALISILLSVSPRHEAMQEGH